MKFSSYQIKGKGRGKLLGFPTINLEIPRNLKLNEGIYAVKVFIKEKEFLGALHFGQVPTFKQAQKTLEVFLIDTTEGQIPNINPLNLEIEIIKYLRPVLKFSDKEGLIKQIEEDVEYIKDVNLNNFARGGSEEGS